MRLVLLALVFFTLQAVADFPRGDRERGERVFWQCRTCHYPEQAVGHNNGPGLWDIFGQQVGSQPGFEYSEALSTADFYWTPELMDVWLQDPARFMPGNMMMSNGVSESQDRVDLIEYLRQFSDD